MPKVDSLGEQLLALRRDCDLAAIMVDKERAIVAQQDRVVAALRQQCEETRKSVRPGACCPVISTLRVRRC
jgi:hypothetical protein